MNANEISAMLPEGTFAVAKDTKTNADFDISALESKYLMARAAACAAMPYLESLIIAMGHIIDVRVTDIREVAPNVLIEVPVMCVTEDGKCMMHPQVVQNVLDNGGGTQALAFMIAHEAMHLLFNHCGRGKRLREKNGDSFNPEADGIAADLSINPSLMHISKQRKPGVMSITMPTGDMRGVLPENYGLKEGLTYEQYYQLLFQSMKQSKSKSGGQGSGQGKGSGKPGNGPGDGKGQSGDQKYPGQGCNVQGEDTPGASKPSDGAKELDKQTPGISQTRMENLANDVMHKAKAHEERNIGSVPAGMLLEINEAVKPPKIRWQDVLRAQVFDGITHREGSEEGVWHKTSRRQAGMGYGAGSPRMPGSIEYKPQVCVIGDTSGSMGGNIGELISETLGIAEETGSEVDFIACDTEAHDGGKVGTVSQLAKQIRGGGGTDMTAALDMAKTKGASVVVCITDGYIGSYGGPRGFKLIWCIVIGGSTGDIQKSVDEGWASFVQIEKDE